VADKDQLEAIKKILQDNNKIENEALRIQKERKETAQEFLTQTLELSKKISQQAKEEIEVITEKIRLEKEQISFGQRAKEDKNRAIAELNKQLEEQNRILQFQNQYIKNITKDLEKEAQEYERLKEVQENLNKTADSAPDFIKGMFSGEIVTSGISKFGNAMQTALVDKMKVAASSATTLGGGLSAMLGPAAILAVGLFAVEILKLAVELGNAENAFMATTGVSREFAHSLSNSYGETREFGATIEQTSAAMTSLFMNFTDFTFQNEKTRESLTNTATVLSKMGVSTDDFSKSIQNMTKAMGMNAEGAAQQLLNLEKFAEELGVAPSKIASDFAGAGGELAKFGDQGVQAFKDLQIASKITGLEMQRILNITEKFDTFEGAAIQAGKLNAALGGNFVNAMDLMMTTDPVERFDQIRGAILNAGLSFDEMSYYQRNFYKEALGLSDVGELALILSGRTDLLSESFDNSSQSYEDAAERAKTLASFQEQLNMLFADMIPILTPIIDVLSYVMSFLADSVQGFSMLYDFLSEMPYVVEILSLAFLALGVAIAAAFWPFTAAVTTTMAVVAGITALIAVIGKFMHSIFRKRNSPTFFEGLSMMPEMFSDLGGEIEVTSKSMQGMGKTMESTPIPAASETLAGTKKATNQNQQKTAKQQEAEQQINRILGNETVRQPVELVLNGDKLEKFIVEVMGANIKKISILQ